MLNIKYIQRNKQNLVKKLFNLKGKLPFGVVMATAGLGVLQRDINNYNVAHILIGLAVLQAVTIPIIAIIRNYLDQKIWFKLKGIRSVRYYIGAFTIPLGLAVISSSLIQIGSGWIQTLGVICLILTWLFSFILIFRFFQSLMKNGCELKEVNGTWFLIPAAFLGAVIATKSGLNFTENTSKAGDYLLILFSSLFGWLGYWLITIFAFIRIYRYRFQKSFFAPWWIFMGCAGLAAASIGQLINTPVIVRLEIVPIYKFGMYFIGLWGILLFFPIIGISIKRFFNKNFNLKNKKIPWPPTFSTIVFTLGCLKMYEVSGVVQLYYISLFGIYLATVIWIITMTRNILYTLNYY